MDVGVPRIWRTYLSRVGFITLVVAIVAGCGISWEKPVDKGTRRQQQFQEMMGRPDIEQVTQRYAEMMVLLRSRLESELGVGQWYEDAETGSSAGCRDFPDVEGWDKQSRGLPFWISKGGVPDAKWPRLVEITQEVAGLYQFETRARVIVDRPGDHEITVADAFGADLILGTKINTVLHVRSGCHLRAEARLRGTPTIPEFGEGSENSR